MNFYESQDIARRNTVKLVVLFLLAVISLIAVTNILIALTLGAMGGTGQEAGMPVDWTFFVWVSLAVLGVILFGSVFKIASLAGGGARVAEMMQAQLITDGSGDPDKQKVLNVVEEMAIASGTPVPPVYLMDEAGINAFAAGYTPGDAVIGVTRGAIQKLSRDELQGVIAHEFSHILHGDMRINIRLIGILHGIMVLGLMGYYLLRTSAMSRRSRNGGNVIFIAIGLIVIGYAGTFFGNLIKSAVSRQREFLADASAVQYTRNPNGIANALKKIGSDAKGSELANPSAAEISHALFSEGVKSSFNALFATHPPLENRIRRIQPDWDGNFNVAAAKPAMKAQVESGPEAPRTMAGGLAATLVLSEALLAQAGNPAEADIKRAREILQALPTQLREAAHDPFSARALVYLLLLHSDASVRTRQMAFLSESADDKVLRALQALQTDIEHIQSHPEHRLPLLNISMPALRQLSQEQYAMFRRNVLALITADRKVSLWEWVLQRILLHQLDPVFNRQVEKRGRVDLEALSSDCAVVLGFLVCTGTQQATQHDAAFSEAVVVLGMPEIPMPDKASLTLQNVNTALDRLMSLKPLQKPVFLKACAAAIAADDEATVEELEVFRAIAEALDCPLPPLPAMGA